MLILNCIIEIIVSLLQRYLISKDFHFSIMRAGWEGGIANCYSNHIAVP